MTMRTLLVAAVALTLLTIAASAPAGACPVCYGSPDSSSTQGMNAAILSLLGVTGGVLGGFVSMFLHMRRRAKLLALQEPQS